MNYCKSATTHRSGRVYWGMSDGDQIVVTASDLTGLIEYQVDTAVGVADAGINDVDPEWVEAVGDWLFVASDQLGRVYRFNLDATTGSIIGLDASFGTGGYVQLKNGTTNLDTNASVAGMAYDTCTAQLWVVAERANLVFRVDANGASFRSDIVVLNVADQPYPQDVGIYGDYLLLSYGANDGAANLPVYGVAVFNKTTGAFVTSLRGPSNELRMGQGLVVDANHRRFFVADGLRGSPNDTTQAVAYNATAADLVLRFTHIP
jgi:hypothetical protein